MEGSLVEAVCSSLRLYLYRNATFLCERLYADFPSDNNLHLLATCYFRSNQGYRAYHILKGSKSAQCRYLFALACFEMDSMAEAEAALLYPNGTGSEVPNGAGGYYMLGLICRLTDRKQAAIGYYTQALTLDPFLWSAYEDLCLLGAEDDAAELYGDAAVVNLQQQHQQMNWEPRTQISAFSIDQFDVPSAHSLLRAATSSGSPKISRLSSSISGEEIVVGGNPVAAAPGVPIVSTMADNLSFITPTGGPSQTPSGSLPGVSIVSAAELPARGNAGASGHPQQRRKFVDEGKFRKSIRSPSTRAAYSQVSGRLFDPVLRRSSRLAGEGKSSVLQMGSISTSGSAPGSPSGSGSSLYALAGSSGSTARGSGSSTLQSSGVRKGLAFGSSESNIDEGKRNGENLEMPGADDTSLPSSKRGSGEEDAHFRSRSGATTGGAYHFSRVSEGTLELLNLLRILGEGFRHLSMYRCQEAVLAFSKLPQQQFATAWVLSQVARAYCEMVDYPEAERIFSWARRISPYHVEGTDIYSTVLYHMKKDVELSYLAQEIVSMDRLSPQAWCVMGNCFSLQKDHETALKFFQRALQIDSHFTYAHTLCGHEYVAMEDFEEGLTCYRNAIRMDSRHYNAWYGLGTIYFRQEKYELAEYHFKRALQINSRSSVLHCYLGMALHALKKNTEALLLLEQSILADKKNPLPKYQKANVLMSEERYNDALEVLEQLKEVAPRESSVFFLMGKIFKRLDLPEKAMYHFLIALDLKPSTADVNLIKIAIEKLHVPDDLEEENL
ncbi:unnamed protein product [Calypogeia fissa]